MGRELGEFCAALGVWGARWREVQPANQSPYLALWILSRLIEPASLPRPRVVVRFDVAGARTPDRFWLLLDRTGNEVCVQPPGFPDDGVVTADTSSLVRWCSGQLTLADALAGGGMTVAACPWLERELARWGALNPYGGIEPARTPAMTAS